MAKTGFCHFSIYIFILRKWQKENILTAFKICISELLENEKLNPILKVKLKGLEKMDKTGVCHTFPFPFVKEKAKIVKVKNLRNKQSTESEHESESDFEREWPEEKC